MRILDSTGDSAYRTVTGALCTALALVSDNRVRNKILTYSGGTYLILDVSHILVTEEFKRCQYRVRSSLTETAERVLLYVKAELLHFIKVLKRAVAHNPRHLRYVGVMGQHDISVNKRAKIINQLKHLLKEQAHAN